jgi:hypothetical protein
MGESESSTLTLTLGLPRTMPTVVNDASRGVMSARPQTLLAQ